jgi:hypothetical protein
VLPLLALLLAVSPATSAPPLPDGNDAGALVPAPAGPPQPPTADAPGPSSELDAGSIPTEQRPADGGLGELPHFQAVRAESPPAIDGDLSDPVWRLAPGYSELVQQQPDPGKAPTVRTTVRFAYDARRLYVAVHCEDPEPDRVTNRLTRRDRIIESDYVILEVDSRGDKKSAYAFGLYPSGVQVDYLRTGDNAQDIDFDAVWSSATRRTDQGWDAELSIPFSVLRFSAGPEVSFRVELSRYLSRKGETDQLVLQPPDAQGALLRMGTLSGLHGLESGHGLELRPFGLSRFDHRYSPSEAYDPPTGNHFGLGVGGDLAFHPTNEITLDGTVLPDFGQVDADQVVLNLSTFETFFPEKRPFFLSGADLFALHDNLGSPTQTQLFYSRRVGRAPGAPALDAGERLLERPLSNEIWGALKVTGRATDHLTVALLDAVSRREFATIQRVDGSSAPVPVSPLSNFGVARLRLEPGGGFTLGATATGVTRRDRDLPLALGCPGSLASPVNGRCTADAYTAGTDATWSSSDGSYVAMLALLGSERRGGPSKTLPDGTVIASGDRGYGGMAQFAKAGGNATFSLNYEGYSPKLDLNDAGYLRQQNLHNLQLFADYRTVRPWGPTLLTDAGLFANARESTDGVNVGRHLQISEFVRWKNFWNSYVELDLDPSADDNREFRDGSIYERAGTVGGVLSAHTDQRKVVTVGGFIYAGTARSGYQLSSSVNVTFRPLDRLELSLAPQVDWSTGDPRWYDSSGGIGEARTYYLGNLTARATSATFRGTYSFTPNFTAQAYAQLFLATEHYDRFFEASVGPGRARVHLADLREVPGPSPSGNPDGKDGSVNINVVLRWEYRPGSVAYLVYTRSQGQGDPTPDLAPNRPDLRALRHGPSDDVVLLKVSYFFET